MPEKLKLALVGCGGIANGKHLPALSKIEAVELVGFCDIVEERAVKAAEKYGTPDAKVYSDYQEMFGKEKYDVVHVLTPNDSHAAIAIAAMESGAHVMSEKPMAKTAAGAKSMLETSRKTGKLLTVGYNNRFRPDSLYLKSRVEAGDLGDIYYAKAHAIRRRAVPTWGVFLDGEKQGGGPLIDIGTHALDLTLWMLNNYDVKYVAGSVFHKLSQRENAANAWGPWDPKKFTVEDSAFGYITMKNGATIVLESSWALNSLDVDEAKVTLCGTEAGADMKGGLRFNGEKLGRMYTENVDLNSGGVAFYEGNSQRDIDVEANQWIKAILTGGKPVVLPEQALVVSEILEAIYASAKAGEPIKF